MRRILGIFIGGAISLLVISTASASTSTTVVVRPSAMHDWAVQTRDSNGTPVTPGTCANGAVNFVTNPTAPPMGVGSAELRTGNGTTGGDCSAELRNSGYNGVKLSSLTSLNYWTYDVVNNGSQFPYLELNISTTGGTTPDDALFFEPPYQQSGNGGACANQAVTARNTWQRWDAFNGCWWSNNGTLNPGTGTGTLADYLVAYPNATIVNTSTAGAVHLVVGFASPTDQFVGNIDAFTIGVLGSETTYNFEPNLPSPTSKGQCKNGGWQNQVDVSGTPFKNQGDCVSYVATDGHNRGNG